MLLKSRECPNSRTSTLRDGSSVPISIKRTTHPIRDPQPVTARSVISYPGSSPHFPDTPLFAGGPSSTPINRLLALACILLQRQTPFDPHFGQPATHRGAGFRLANPIRPMTAVLPTRERKTGRAIHGINALFASARRGQAPKPAPAGAPKAQGLTALRRRGTINDAVNRKRWFRMLSDTGSDALLEQPNLHHQHGPDRECPEIGDHAIWAVCTFWLACA